MKLFGVKVQKLTKEEQAQHDQARARAGEITSSDLRLKHAGDVGLLAGQGWTNDDVERLLNSWSGARAISITMLVSLAAALQSKVPIESPEEVVAWTHALYEEKSRGLVVLRPLVRDQIAARTPKPRLLQLVALYCEAGGSHERGLAALESGLTVEEATKQRDA